MMREAYRLKKGNFVENVKACGKAVDMVLLFSTYLKDGNSAVSLSAVEKSIESIMQRIVREIGAAV